MVLSCRVDAQWRNVRLPEHVGIEMLSGSARLQHCIVQIVWQGVTNKLSGSIYDTVWVELYIQNANDSPPAVCAVLSD